MSYYPPVDLDPGHVAEPVEPVRRSAPASVHVAAVLGYLAGLVLVTAGVGAWAFSFGAGPSADPSRYGPAAAGLGQLGLAAGAVAVFAGLLVLVLARKLQRGRQWVRVLVVVASAFAVTTTLYNGLVGPGQANALFGLVFPVIFLVLLNLGPARSFFRR